MIPDFITIFSGHCCCTKVLLDFFYIISYKELELPLAKHLAACLAFVDDSCKSFDS